MAETKKKSRLWSLSEIKKMAEIIESGINAGKTKGEAYDEAASHFGVTRNAIHIRYHRYKDGVSMTRVKRNTSKKPTKGLKRGKYTKKSTAAVQTKAVKEVKGFLESQSRTRELRKMVLDLLDSSGHIKAVSVDLSNKSFTVIY